MIGELIKNIAIKDIGEKETPGNSGFIDKSFEEKMKQVGWQKGQAWCSYFAEKTWKEAYAQYKPKVLNVLDKLFSASATETYKNFDIHPDFEVSNTPKIGALAVWRHGIGWQGHVGIVVETDIDHFKSVEGNTNAAGGREGIEVAEKTRKLDFTVKPDQLNLIGFVLPLE